MNLIQQARKFFKKNGVNQWQSVRTAATIHRLAVDNDSKDKV